MEEAAGQIVNTLVTAGHETYFVGGWVRDKILGTHSPNDIDIATAATPDQIKDLFEHTIPVGEAFGIIVVIINDYKFEIATFRTDGIYVDGRRPESVKYATAKEDAMRRDFTINGLFYNPATSVIHDYVGGRDDLSDGIIRCIGNPYDRFKEDKLRMLRAVRYVVRYEFTLDSETEKAIMDLAPQVAVVSVERIWAELVKMSQSRYGEALCMLDKLGLLKAIGLAKTVDSIPINEINMLPYEARTIVGIMLIDSDTNAEKLCGQLKVSTAILRKAKLFERFRAACCMDTSLHQWAQIYSMPDIDTIVECAGSAKITEISEHQERRVLLEENIRRIQTKTPIVTSEMLVAAGVAPGPQMGSLLRKAEELSANHGIYNCTKLLEAIMDL